LGLGGAAIAGPLPALAQAVGRVYRVGVINIGNNKGPFDAPLVAGLSHHGYEEGKNLEILRRPIKEVAEVVASKPDAVVAIGYASALAAKQETTLPAVVFSAGDPVATGLVNSIAEPGGHLTGIADISVEVTPKRMQLLREFAPNMRSVAMLWNADDPAMDFRYRASEAGAKALGISVRPLGVRAPADFETAFAAMSSDRPDGILLVSDPLVNLNRKKIFEFATAHRLPAIYEYDFIVRDGGLMSYGLDVNETFDRVAALVDRILRGAKPAELPFEQPTRFRFALNLGAAREIGAEPSPSLLALADEVIE
ncbi:MAG TPA: ABC transporter substrate-binding protein, partial [Stellaceae bacterium]|nr:ABC transporter substrate-binding protein [Stellaceae bacterium]